MVTKEPNIENYKSQKEIYQKREYYINENVDGKVDYTNLSKR